ncbi:hypothetical protein H8S45_12965 [Agathobaculum sp. NSJ-28]|uniref:DUF4367 domain-containing protein n=1 Tax=Agathobaculum faecis TaxID=2763013 RepID=A0A923LXT3_9FIRM|nr:hypothetical protein [Agathobaculum faecis]MBC5726366.1 hypothetical protein [Agathobaculum faecis]MBS6883505.1 hypothetical protein [Clostridiaceae bacterium]
MDEMKMDRTIRETMKQCAEGLEAPDKLKTRIDFALKSGAPAELRRRPKWGKRLAAVCLVAAVAVTGAVAGSGVVSWGSSTRLDKNWTDFEKTAAYVQENIAGAKYVESFSNGFVFEKGNESTTDKRDENNHTLGSFTGIQLDYEQDGVKLTLAFDPVQEEGEYTSPYDTVRTVAGTEVHYREMKGIYLPADGNSQPTAEEQAAFDRGEINIAYGSDEREEKVFYRVSWIEGDIAYSIYTFDPGSLTMDDFFQMAQEVIEA